MLWLATLALAGQTSSGAMQSSPQVLRLTLGDAIRLALSPQGSMTVAVAQAAVPSAEARMHQAQDVFHPDIDSTFTVQNQILNLAAMGFQGVTVPLPGFVFPKSSGEFSIFDARMHVKQDLLDFSARDRIKAANATLTTAETDVQNVRENVATNVAQLYLAAQHAAAKVKLAQASVDSAESTLRSAKTRADAGKGLIIDVTHANTQLAAERQQLLHFQFSRDRIQLELLSVINRDLQTPLELSAATELDEQENLSAEQATALALKTRHDIQAQKRRIDALRLSDGAIDAERLPSVAAYADFGTLGTTIPKSIGTYDVGVSLRVPVFDGRRRDSRRAELVANIRQEDLRLAELENDVRLQVRQALLDIEDARGQLEICRKQSEIAREELEHRGRRFAQGIAVEAEMTEARLVIAQTDDAEADAAFALDEARIELLRAMGAVSNLAK